MMNEQKNWHLWLRPCQHYFDSWQEQLHLHCRIVAKEHPETLILTEHFAVYTLGRLANMADFRDAKPRFANIPVLRVDRGGKVTYHGPGQLMAYCLRDLRPWSCRVRQHVYLLEEVVIRLLQHWQIKGYRMQEAVGVWVDGAKIAALGIRVKNGVTYHGIAFNHHLDLTPFTAIWPCGLDRPVTSLQTLGVDVDAAEVKKLLCQYFSEVMHITFDHSDAF